MKTEAAYEQTASELEAEVILAKVDTQDNSGLAASFGVQSIPTFLIFERGRELARRSGTMDSSKLAQWIRQHY